jgi:hypothetical protein
MKRTLRILLMLLLLSLFSAQVSSAELSYGFMGGVGAAHFRGEDSGGFQGVFSFSAGGFLETGLSQQLTFKPELLFSFKPSESTSSPVPPWALISPLYVETRDPRALRTA